MELTAEAEEHIRQICELVREALRQRVMEMEELPLMEETNPLVYVSLLNACALTVLVEQGLKLAMGASIPKEDYNGVLRESFARVTQEAEQNGVFWQERDSRAE